MEMTEQDVWNIMCLPTIDELFPVVFENGSKVDGLAAHCAKCGKEVPSGDLHATLTRTRYNAVIAGHALCFECHTATPFEARLRDDGTFLCRKKNGWLEGRYNTGRRPGGGLAGWLRRLWKA